MASPYEVSTQPAGPPSSGAIHDIGYRPYTGERSGRGSIGIALYVHSLRTAFGLGRTTKAKVLPFILLGLVLLPVVIIVAVAVVLDTPDLPIEYTQYVMFIQAIIGLFLATTSPQLFSRDLRFNTISLYLSRPLERIDYVTAKFTALVSALLILTWLPLIVLYGGALLAQLDFGEHTANLVNSLAGATLLSVLLAGIGSLIASVATRRGIGVAAIIAVLVLSSTGVNMVGGIAMATENETVSEYAGLFSPFTLIDSVQVWALGAENLSSPLIAPTSNLVGFVYLFVTLALAAGCFALLLLRYRHVTRK